MSTDTWGFVIKDFFPGKYECELHFAQFGEYKTFPEEQVFDIDINGQFIYDLNVVKSAGSETLCIIYQRNSSTLDRKEQYPSNCSEETFVFFHIRYTLRKD